MSKFICVFALILLATFANGQSVESRQLSSFDKIYISGSLDAILQAGNEESVKIEATNVETAKIITEIKNNALYVYLEKSTDGYRNIRVKVFITYKNLVAINKSGSGNLSGKALFKASEFNMDVSGSGNINLDGSIEGKEVHFNKSGSGNIKVNNVEAENIAIVVSGSGNTDISKGNAKKQTIRLSGSGNINTPGLNSEDCTATISGSGDIDILVTKSLDGKIAGSGNILYHGNGQLVNSSISGSGRIHKKS